MAVVRLDKVQWPAIVLKPLKCRRKASYRLRSDAQAVAGRINSNRGGLPSRRRAEAYKCPFCGDWHVGKREGGR